MQRLKMSWDEKQEDIWQFESEDQRNELILKLDSYDPKKDSNLRICVEFIMHYIPKKTA
jgi:hypothetical protein